MTFRMQGVYRALLFALGASLFAGCAGGNGINSGTSPLAVGGHDLGSDAATAAPKGGVTFTLGITPRLAGNSQNSRKRQYISASTESMSIVTDGKKPGTNFDLTPSSPDCKPNPSASGSYICTLSLTVPNGNHVFTLTAYDEPGSKGNVLSTNSTGTVDVTSSGTTVAIALEGVVKFAFLTLANPNPPTGTATSIPLTVVLEDADKNMIVGPAAFNNPVTLTTTDAKNGPLSATTVTSPADLSGIVADYDGAVVSSITYSATASGLSSTDVTPAVLTPVAPTSPSPTPTATPKTAPTATASAKLPSPSPVPTPTATPPPLAVTSTGALSTLEVAGTVYAFIPTSSISLPSSGTLIEVPVLNGKGVITSLRTHHNMTLVPSRRVDSEQTIHKMRPMTRVHPDYVNPGVTGTAGVIACSPDQTHLRLYCIGNSNNNIIVVDGSKVPATVIATYSTDAVNLLGYSGGNCYVCGVVYDPTDDAAIVGTSNGIEVYSSSGSHVSTTLANVSETFGYNPATNQVFNPEYSGRTGLPTPSIDVIDIKSATDYTLSPSPSGIADPDQGAVDSSTNIGLGFEEYDNFQYYLVPIGSGTFTKSASGNTFTEANQVTFPFTSQILSTTCSLAADGIAIDSVIHVAFFNAEFCPGTVGAAQLPTSKTAAPTISSFAFAPLPATPDGNAFNSGYDPHAQSVITGGTGDFGLLFNSTQTYLAVTDLKKLLAAPRNSGDPTSVESGYNLLSNKVVTYVPI